MNEKIEKVKDYIETVFIEHGQLAWNADKQTDRKYHEGYTDALEDLTRKIAEIMGQEWQPLIVYLFQPTEELPEWGRNFNP